MAEAPISSHSHGGSSSNTAPAPPSPPTPTARAVDIVVLDSLPRLDTQDDQANSEDDFWLSTVDGRYSSPPIPVRVGQGKAQQTFYVHKDVLLQSQWFRTALCSDFKEAYKQAVDLPEEDPAIFHFLIAFLYEKQFNPVKRLADALGKVEDKGKGRARLSDDSDSSIDFRGNESVTSDDSNLDQRLRRAVERRSQHETARLRQKQPGHHREACQCPGCLERDRPRCWNCGALPSQPPPPPRNRRIAQRAPIQFGFDDDPIIFPDTPGVPENIDHDDAGPQIQHNDDNNRPGSPRRTPFPPVAEGIGGIRGEDLQTWLMTYELVLEVYICANRFLLDDFMKVVMRRCIDMLETAGVDAAQPAVLQQCRNLLAGVPESDPLLKMVLARVGFLQAQLWKRHPTTTADFLKTNPDVSAMMLRETVLRHDKDMEKAFLPSMERERRKPVSSRRRTRRYIADDATFRY